MINDLIKDLTKLEKKERIPLGRLPNNNNERHAATTIHSSHKECSTAFAKRSSLLSGMSRGSVPESVIVDNPDERVSILHLINSVHI